MRKITLFFFVFILFINLSFPQKLGETFELVKKKAKKVYKNEQGVWEAEFDYGIKMVFVEGGEFKMGSPSGVGDNNEHPQHKVYVDSFWIGKYEVTQRLWKLIMGNNPSRFKGDNLPVEKVSWNDVKVFIRKLNNKTGLKFRLPTEAEWEYAARGGKLSKGYIFSGSNNVDEVGWYWRNSGNIYLKGDWEWNKIKKNNNKTHPVGLKKPNELGIYDMSGNVVEWCSDWYNSNYYSQSPYRNPKGPSSGSKHVSRGDGWGGDAEGLRCTNRSSYNSYIRGSGLGFRLVLGTVE